MRGDPRDGSVREHADQRCAASGRYPILKATDTFVAEWRPSKGEAGEWLTEHRRPMIGGRIVKWAAGHPARHP